MTLLADPKAAKELSLDPHGLQTPRSGLRAGLQAPFRALRFVLSNPGLWLLCMVPVLWMLIISAALGTVSVMLLPGWIGALLGPTPVSWYGQLAASAAVFVVTALGVVLSFVVGLALAQPLSAPALERMARALELDIGAAAPAKVPLWRQLGRAVGGVLVGACTALPILLLLSVVSVLVPPAVWVTVPLKFLVLGLWVTWDLMDYPFSVRGWGLLGRARWMQEQKGAVLGLGLSLGVFLLVPCAQLLLLPLGVVGATWLYHERQKTLGEKAKKQLESSLASPRALGPGPNSD